MATSVAHGLIGIACYCAVRSLSSDDKPLPINMGVLVLAGVLANVPDLDMVVSLLFYGDHRILHGAFTHTLLFSLGAGLVAWLVLKKIENYGLIAFAVFVILLSHVVVDFLTGPIVGLYSTYGANLFWPFVEGRVSFPVTLFKGVEHSNILPGALYTAFWEFVLIAPPVILIIYLSKKKDALDRGDVLSKIYFFINGFHRNCMKP